MSEAYLAGRALISALGADLAQALQSLRAGGVAPGAFELITGQRVPYLAIAPTAEDWRTRTRRMVREVAARAGAAQARDGALFLATTSFDIGARETQPVFDVDAAAFGEEIAGWLDWRGPVFSISTACTSALNALISARALIRAGQVHDALVVGVELSNHLTIGGFCSMQLMASRAALPLGAERDGLVLGEAVAALHVSATPARWRLCGGANVVDNSDPAGASAAAVAAMCRQALGTSGLQPQQIDLVKLQAAGSPGNDATELAGLRQVFRPLPPLLSLKAWLGHTLGAAGAAEIALLLSCIEAGRWPVPDYRLDPALDVSLAQQAPPRLRHLLASVLAFGGGHAAVVLEDRQAGAAA